MLEQALREIRAMQSFGNNRVASSRAQTASASHVNDGDNSADLTDEETKFDEIFSHEELCHLVEKLHRFAQF